jgi:tetratricopeptide (TPR) repeat protein
LAALVLLGGAAVGWGAPLDDAQKLLSEGKAAQARGVVSTYLETHPGDRGARFLLANILAQEGRLDAAYDVFQGLVAETPDDGVGKAVQRLFRQRGATAADAVRVGRLFGAAQQATQAKRWDAAIQALTEAVGLAPDNLAGRNNLAQLLQQEGRYEQAATQMEALVRLRPGDIGLVKRLALLYDRLERTGQAMERYEQVLKARPKDPEALFGMGRAALFFERDYARSSDFFGRVLEAKPSAEAAYLLGLSREALEDTAGAQAAFERTVALDPTYYKAHFKLGEIHEAAGRDGEALSAFQRTAQYGGDSPEAEQSRRRIALFGTSPEVARRVRTALDAGLGALGAGQLGAAKAAFQEVLTLVPGNTLALYNLATVYTREGDTEAATDALKRAVASDETHFLSHYGLALIYSGAGRFEDAYEAYQQVLRWAPPDTPYHAEAEAKVEAVQKILAEYASKQDARNAFLEGNRLAAEGQTEEALVQFRKAIELDPINPFYHYNAGIMLGDQAKYEDAFNEFREALKLKPDHVQSHFRVGLLYFGTGKYQEAAKELRDVIRYGTTEPEVAEAKKRLAQVLPEADRLEKSVAYLVVGNALSIMGESDRALDALRRAKSLAPEDLGIIQRLTELLLQADLNDEALEVVNEGLEVDPDDPQLQFYYGQIQGKLGNEEAGINALRKAAELAPDRLDGWVVLSRAQEKLERYDEAVDTLRTFVEAHPDHYRAVMELGRLFRRLNRPADAAALYDWYLPAHEERAEMLLERGLAASALGASGQQAVAPADTALAGLVTTTEGAAGAPRYRTPNEWFERVIATAGPGDERLVQIAQAQIAQSRRLRMDIRQTVLDYNTNANNSATSPKTGMSSEMIFSISYLTYRSPRFTLPISFSTAHNLHYTFQTYVNTNTLQASLSTVLPYVRLTPNARAVYVRTQRGRSSQRLIVGATARGQLSFPRTAYLEYTRTDFTSFTNSLNNYLEGRFDARMGHGFPLGMGVRMNWDLRYFNRVRDVVAARLDTDRTDATAKLGLSRNFSRQRSLSLSAFYTDSQDIRAANLRPGTNDIVPIESHIIGGTGVFSFRPYPKVTGSLSGSYSTTDFFSGVFRTFTDPVSGDPITRETQQTSTSVSYSLRFVYRPSDDTSWSLDIGQVEAHASQDVPADLEDILTNQVNQENINKRRTFTLTMSYSF